MKPRKHKITLIFLFGCLVFSSTLYSAQRQNTLEEKEHQASAASPNEVSNVDWHCSSAHDCEAVLCIVNCLKYWQKLKEGHNLIDTFSYLSVSNNYRNVIDAYHHVLDKHFCNENSRGEYRYINEKVSNEVKCPFKKCVLYNKNQRERNSDQEDQLENLDKEAIFLCDLLDTMHAYFVHSYDSGHRYVHKDMETDTALNDGAIDGNNEETSSLFLDEELKNLKKWLHPIKKQQRNQDRCNRYYTKIDGKQKANDRKISLSLLKEKFGADNAFKKCLQYLKENECDTDNLLEEIAVDENAMVVAIDETLLSKIKTYIKQQQAENENKKVCAYGLGLRLYYWDYYKNSQEDREHNPGVAYIDLCVLPAYLSLKSEILAKGISITAWDQKIYDAQMLFLRSATLRKLKVDGGSLSRAYGIQKDSALSTWHTLSLLLYTNFTSLYAGFSSSFRYLSHSENLKDVIKRNAQWYFLSKYLREVVEVFGERIGKGDKGYYKDKGSFYHGISYLLFSSFRAHFYAPLTTSKQLEVALLFANETSSGLVLELKQGSGARKCLRFFNVSLISCFAAEEERLFIGGEYPLKIASIRVLKDNTNTKSLMHALFLIDKMIKGENRLGNATVTRSDQAIFAKLLSSSTGLPHYVQQLWKAFRDEQQIIKMNINDMYAYYRLFVPLLFDPKCNNLLLFDKIATIFPNATEIICTNIDSSGDSYMDFSPSIICSDFILGVQKKLSAISNYTKLKKITIKAYFCLIQDECELYTVPFDKLGWKIGKGRKTIVLTKNPYEDFYNDFTLKILPMIAKKYLKYGEVTSLDIPIFNKLIAGGNDVPYGIQQKWAKFAKGQQIITINMAHMYADYKLFLPLLFSSEPKCKNLLLLDTIAKIFPNVTEIICVNTDKNSDNSMDYSSSILCSNFILGLKDRLVKMPKHAKLKKIMIKTEEKEIEDNCNLYATQLAALGWHIQKEKETGTYPNGLKYSLNGKYSTIALTKI